MAASIHDYRLPFLRALHRPLDLAGSFDAVEVALQRRAVRRLVLAEPGPRHTTADGWFVDEASVSRHPLAAAIR